MVQKLLHSLARTHKFTEVRIRAVTKQHSSYEETLTLSDWNICQSNKFCPLFWLFYLWKGHLMELGGSKLSFDLQYTGGEELPPTVAVLWPDSTVNVTALQLFPHPLHLARKLHSVMWHLQLWYYSEKMGWWWTWQCPPCYAFFKNCIPKLRGLELVWIHIFSLTNIFLSSASALRI